MVSWQDIINLNLYIVTPPERIPNGAWIEWVLYFLDGVFETSKWTMSKIFAIQELMEESSSLIKSKAPSIYSKELIELLFTQPYVRIQNLIDSGEIGRFTASKRLKVLCDIGFLEEVKRGREKLFINHRFLNLLKNSYFKTTTFYKV